MFITIGFQDSCDGSFVVSMPNFRAIEAILSIEMMNNNWFCPNLNLKNVDEECAPLDYIKDEARNIETEYVMTNNFAFGGINTSLIIKRI